MKNKEVFDLAQLIIGLDILLKKYNGLSVEQKLELIKVIENVKQNKMVI